jgi:nicotinamidase-related amidase
VTDVLVLVDFVNDLVSPNGKLEKLGTAAHVASRNVIGNAVAALTYARGAGIKVVHVRVSFEAGHPELQGLPAPFYKAHIDNNWLVKDTWGTEFVEPLASTDGEKVIVKHRVNPFTNPSFAEALDLDGTVTLAGVSTNLAIEETVRTGAALGYRLQVLEDACASNNQEMHDFAITNMFPKFATVINTGSFVVQ